MNTHNISWSEVYVYHKRALLLWWKMYPPVLISSVLSAAMEVAVPYVTVWFSARIIQELSVRQDKEALISLVVIFLVTELLLGSIKVAAAKWYEIAFWLVYCGNNVVEQHFNEKLYSLDFADVDNNATWDLYAQISQNDNWAWWGLRKELPIFQQLVKAVFGIGGGIGLTWQLFAQKMPVSAGSLRILDHPVFLAVFIMFMIGMAVLSPAIRTKVIGWEVAHADMARFGNRLWLYGGFLGFHRENTADIRMYRQEEYCKEILNNPDYDMFGIHSAFAKLAKGKGGMLHMAADATGRLFTVAVYMFVCLKSWAGAFGVGAVTQYISAVTLLYTNMVQFLDGVGELRNNAVFLESTFTFFDIPNQMYQGSLTTEKRTDCDYEVEFRHVSFKYPDTEEYVLKDVSMKFKVGQKLAIVGENGSGKTTFIKLLCRLYDPDEGQILLNGIDIRKYDYREYMSVFSVVFQDFKLLSFPLGENVAAGVTYDEEKVWECLSKAGIKERAEAMEKGLSNCLYKDFDDTGVEISGGEAQKIALARALYRETAFMILDEPTAALDPLAEYEIYSKFNEIAGARTAIYISHRLSSCRFCDEIAVFHEGTIIQQGSYEELVAEEEGKYYELWNAQAQYYVEV